MSLDVYLMRHSGYLSGSEHGEVVEELFQSNITHNLGRMAAEAGIYEAVWRPEEVGISVASQMIEPLKNGISLMKKEPERFKKFDAPNGWGLYEHFVPWLQKYLATCVEYPDATIRVSR